MKPKTILLIMLLLTPIFSIAHASESQLNAKKLKITDIKTLIEEAKDVSSEERVKIETKIRKKIAQAHREKPFK